VRSLFLGLYYQILSSAFRLLLYIHINIYDYSSAPSVCASGARGVLKRVAACVAVCCSVCTTMWGWLLSVRGKDLTHYEETIMRHARVALLHCTAACYSMLQRVLKSVALKQNEVKLLHHAGVAVLHCTAVCCRMLHCVLQSIARTNNEVKLLHHTRVTVLYGTAVCYSVMQFVAVCVAVYCTYE